MLGLLFSKKLGSFVEVALVVAYISFLFKFFSFQEAIFLFTIAATTYAYAEPLFNRSRYEIYQKLVERLQETTYVEINQTKKASRLIIDFILTVFVMAGSIIFLLFAPETYALLKFFIILAFIAILVKTIERTSNFVSSTIYWLPGEEKLFILTRFQPREYPLSDLKRLDIETSPDLLRLHPLFTFLSATVDCTSSFQRVLKLSFPGEHLYLTPDDIEKWSHKFRDYAPKATEQKVKEVRPLWHPTVLKRLLWKGYFAIAVKGISAYTGLVFLLIWLDAPVWVVVLSVIMWWVFNLYISDRVLIAATDARRVTEGEMFIRAREIFRRANIKNAELYMTDSPIYNGFATGMNIGRGTIIITSATLELPMQAVEAIIAHETIHVKKRDVLTIQFARILFLGVLASSVYLFYDTIVLLADHPFVLVTFIYMLFLLFPIYLSFISQWAEGRADNLGATLLAKGRQQMADGLRELAIQSEKAFEKTREYQATTVKKNNYRSELERQNWFYRLIEFQFQAHPPMYWRIYSLETYRSWTEARKHWMLARITESLPSFN